MEAMTKILADLVEGALAHFCLNECPHCQYNIEVGNYVSREMIEGWLKGGHKLCPKCGADRQVWREMLHEEHKCP